jgi:hypothetical protein
MVTRTKKKIVVPDTLTGNSELDKGLANIHTMPNVEALDVALALQQIIRGQESLLSNQEKFGKELSDLRGRMDAYDKAEIEFNENKEKFIEKVVARSESLKATGDKKDRILAKGALMMQSAVKDARASIVSDNLAFEEKLARMPRVTVTSPGKLETIMQGGVPTPVMFPEEIRIKHKVWVLRPGVPTEVPEIVAKALDDRRKVEAENASRSELLQKNLNNDELISRMRDIDRKFGITHEE